MLKSFGPEEDQFLGVWCEYLKRGNAGLLPLIASGSTAPGEAGKSVTLPFHMVIQLSPIYFHLNGIDIDKLD